MQGKIIGICNNYDPRIETKALLEGIGPNIQSIDAYLLSDASNDLYKINDEKR